MRAYPFPGSSVAIYRPNATGLLSGLLAGAQWRTRRAAGTVTAPSHGPSTRARSNVGSTPLHREVIHTWRSLTQAERDAWSTAALFEPGGPDPPPPFPGNGWSYFVAVATALLQAQLPIPTTPAFFAVGHANAALLDVWPDFERNNLEINWLPIADPLPSSADVACIYLGPPTRQSQRHPRLHVAFTLAVGLGIGPPLPGVPITITPLPPGWTRGTARWLRTRSTSQLGSRPSTYTRLLRLLQQGHIAAFRLAPTTLGPQGWTVERTTAGHFVLRSSTTEPVDEFDYDLAAVATNTVAKLRNRINADTTLSAFFPTTSRINDPSLNIPPFPPQPIPTYGPPFDVPIPE